MTDPKQMRVITAKNTEYAWNASVTIRAGISMNQKRIAGLILALLVSVMPAFAQGTAVPYTIPQYFDNNGDPLSGGRLCTFAAGTSTLATTYTTALLNVANANPVPLNSAGRPSNGVTTVGIFLTPGTSYKLVLKDSTTTTCVPDTGVTIWSVDNITAVPTSSVNVDIPGTAGEAILAGQAMYLSDGSGSKVAGSWYLADADLYYGGALPEIGLAVNDIASGASGSIRMSGRMDTLSGLTPGLSYYLSSTPGALTLTAPVMARQIGQADSTTSIVLQPNPRSTPIRPRAPCGRLSLTTGVPVTVNDVTAATTLYYAPYGGCSAVSVFDGASSWYQMDFPQVSIAVPTTTNTMYDVFGYDNGGAFALELTAWTNDTTRATALTTQNGVYVKTGATTRLYLGTFRTTAVSGQTEDSYAKRWVWNYYNRVLRPCRVLEPTNSWTYTTATWRQANANTANQVDVVVGVAEDAIQVSIQVVSHTDASGAARYVAVGEDSTSAPSANTIRTFATDNGATAGVDWGHQAALTTIPSAGRRTFVWLEYAVQPGGATTVWLGDNGAALMQSGIWAMWKG